MLKRFTDPMRYPISRYMTESAECPIQCSSCFNFLLSTSKIDIRDILLWRKERGIWITPVTFLTLTDHLIDLTIKLLPSRTSKEFYVCSIFIFRIFLLHFRDLDIHVLLIYKFQSQLLFSRHLSIFINEILFKIYLQSSISNCYLIVITKTIYIYRKG